jgi:hypothetical protein
MHLAGWCNRAGLVKSAVLPLVKYDNILGIGEIGQRGLIFRPSCTSICSCAQPDPMCEAGIQIFHLGSDVIPAETRGCVSSGFAHGSREV